MKESLDKTEASIDAIAAEPTKPVRPSPVVDSKAPEEVKKVEPQKPSSTEVELRKVEKDFVTGEQRKSGTIYIGVDAKIVPETEPHFAKKTVTKHEDGSEVVKYSLAIYNGSLYNPASTFSRRNRNLKDFFAFKTCSEACFNDYITFLETKREQVYWRANRSILND